MTVLMLGGTAEARALARELVAQHIAVTTSLAGRVANPALPAGELRIGGFGGVDGLVEYLHRHHVDAVVDATHPFAQRISTNAASACARAEVPLVGLRRPEWERGTDDQWIEVPDIAASAAAIPAAAARVFLTTGRQDAHVFADHPAWFLIRVVDPPTGALPAHHQLLRSRGPYCHDDEMALLRDNAIDVVVTKNSGGQHTYAKIAAARELGIPVVVVSRPPTPPGVDYLSTVPEVVQRLSTLVP